MRIKGGGVGFLIAIIVVAVVLVLTAKSWESAAPAAEQVLQYGNGASVDDHGTGAGEELRSGDLPNLNEMKKETDAHSQQVQEIMSQVE